MANNYGLNKYKQTSVTTANRGQILLMLYEGAMKFCRQAIDAINTKNLSDKGKYILKVQDILNELSVTLDHNVGGEISKELERLYNYMVDQITESNIKNDTKGLEQTLKLLNTLYEGWVIAVQQVNTATNSNAAPSNPQAQTEKQNQTTEATAEKLARDQTKPKK
ncbi:MAG: flagellar export chaperone FliS [Bdellovibrionota bacterium]